MPQGIISGREKRFKSLTDTYRMTSFLLTLAFMYPNPRRDGIRKILIGFLILSQIPVLIMCLNDARFRILNNDMINLVRQCIITVAVSFVILKLILSIARGREMKSLLDGINKDYEKYNYLPEEHQRIVVGTIKKTKLIEKIWITVMAATALSYPLLAGVFTMYSTLISDEPKRFMVHEVKVMFLTDEQKYESPYYELLYIYYTFVTWVVFLGFTGYDGMFTVCILHVTLKIKIFSLNLKYIFTDMNDVDKIKRNIGQFVEDHCEVSRLIAEMQKCFEIWLAGIFFVSVLQIGMALSQITTDVGSDITAMYYFFVVTTVLYIYLPCHFASDVTLNAVEVADMAYKSSWASISDVGVRKSVCLIIAKAQIPIKFKAFGMLTFNMEMFVSILQTAYSMYTLLRA